MKKRLAIRNYSLIRGWWYHQRTRSDDSDDWSDWGFLPMMLCAGAVTSIAFHATNKPHQSSEYKKVKSSLLQPVPWENLQKRRKSLVWIGFMWLNWESCRRKKTVCHSLLLCCLDTWKTSLNVVSEEKHFFSFGPPTVDWLFYKWIKARFVDWGAIKKRFQCWWQSPNLRGTPTERRFLLYL